MSQSSGLDVLYGSFQMLSEVQKLYEASSLKHRLRRLGFEPPAADSRAPFVAGDFYGEGVLTPARSGHRGLAVNRSDCVIYFGVLARALVDRIVVTVRAGRAEMQVGVALNASQQNWSDANEERLEVLRKALGERWTIGRVDRPNRITRCLAAREDVLYFLERTADDPVAIIEARDQFYKSRWEEFSGLSQDDFEWLKRRGPGRS